MKYRQIGSSEILVSEISLGCWTLGGLNWVNGVPNGWADVDEKEVIAAVHYALDLGVNHFDNADVYGNGRAERLLAKALENRSKEVIIATKVGWFQGTSAHAYEPQHIRHQLEQSLVNLRREYVDIYYFHHADFGESDYYLPDAVEVMYRLKEEGKIRIVGQSAYTEGDFLRVVPVVKPEVLQAAANILDDHFIREGTPLYRLLKERGMTFIAFSPLAQGLLLGKYSAQNPPVFAEGDHRKKSNRFSPEYLAKVEKIIAPLKEHFGGEVRQLARVALQYILFQDVVSAVIPGFRNRAQVEANLWGQDLPLTREDIIFIRQVVQRNA